METDNSWPVIGHKKIIKFLDKSIKSDKLSHAYLFVGPKHLGKSLVASHFIKLLLCKNSNDIPCDICSNCNSLERGIYSDFYEISPEKDKKDISVDSVRSVIKRTSNSSFLGGYKIVLINDAKALNDSSANALLKTLEEPLGKTILILLSDDPNSILPTIKSRCQTVNFNPVDIGEDFVNFTDSSVDKGVVKEIISLTGGRPGLAIRYGNNSQLMDRYKKSVIDFLSILNHPVSDRFDYIDEMIGKERDFGKRVVLANKTLDQWLLVFRDLLLVRSSNMDSVGNIFVADRLRSIAGKYSENKIILFIDRINKAKRYLKSNVNPQLILENLILNF